MNSKKKIKELIGDNRVGMFVTQDEGKIYSRPIAYAEVDDDNNVWFFTDINSGKIDDIINNKQVNFSFSNSADNAYVSLSGTAEIINDKALIDAKWSFYMKAWYPEGKDAERLTLIKVSPESVQYWDGSGSDIVLAYDMAKALITGRSYVDVADSDNETVYYETVLKS